MKKLLSLLLALAMTMSLAACGEKKDAEDANADTKQEEKVETKEEMSGEEAATKAMTGFLDAVCDLDFAAAEEYFDGEIPAELKSTLGDLDNIASEVMNEMPEELSAYKKDFEDVMNTMIDKAKASINYEIKNVEGEGEKYTFTVEVAYPDENFDAEAAFNDAFGDVEDKTIEIVTKLAEEGKITETSTEQELMDAVMPEIIKLLKDSLNNFEFGTVSEEIEFTVVLKDGKWLVTDEE